MMREFRRGDVVREAGTNVKSVVVGLRREVSQVKIKILEGDDEGEERWLDSYDCQFYYTDEPE